MVTQKSINFKMDLDLFESLDNLCSITGFSRNWMINYMVRFCVQVCELQIVCSKSVHFFNLEDN